MTETTFIIALSVYLVLATVLLYRSPTHGWGFAMFFLLFPIFLIAYFFVKASFVMVVWFGLAIVNMAAQYFFMRREGVQSGFAGMTIGSLFLWPVQFAAALSSSETEKEVVENKAVNKEKIGPLPATIKGTVSFSHHHGTEEGHDSVWLEEFGDLDFMTDSKTFDRIGIQEGKTATLDIDERDPPTGMATGKILWIIDGESD